MNILNSEDYYNAIYSAIIVDDNTNDDPDSEHRYQIYIPKLHYEYSEQYKSYMNDNSKTTNPLYWVFPWALSLADGLRNRRYCICW